MTRHHPKLASRVVDNSILALVLAGGDILWHRAWLCRDAHFTQLGIGSSLIAELDAIANILATLIRRNLVLAMAWIVGFHSILRRFNLRNDNRS